MSNKITIELCEEDRARIDRLIAAVEKQTVQVESALKQRYDIDTEKVKDDPVQKALAEVVARASNATENHEETTETQTPTTTTQAEEKPTGEENEPTGEENEPTVPVKTVTRAELGAKVREMMTKGFKEQTKEIVKSYAPTVPEVPEDKVAECYAKLVKLEG